MSEERLVTKVADRMFDFLAPWLGILGMLILSGLALFFVCAACFFVYQFITQQ